MQMETLQKIEVILHISCSYKQPLSLSSALKHCCEVEDSIVMPGWFISPK